ncbi:hypothetical protein B0T26DRAFT_732266 [Lasiosphaeria miniovina]|uniref:Amidoligase enzyme n=1 Tax=Lasiosphaeria miniovina TaxID=1954250 RepID=A0AA39ZUD7_9PEZI|nr:uncharacterized protein B0T26DRAFT_732266 [Lasiosphaeria miniovina]KAK0703690.1 hypothetical protein B0T26DRAFT_732266 [Lasiosphaeria miniovina]
MASPIPLWGSEHELLLELKADRVDELRQFAFQHEGKPLPQPWQGWDFDITTDANESVADVKDKKVSQRNRLHRAVKNLLGEAGVTMDDGVIEFGGWSVVDDESLDEAQAPSKHYWRIEIVSRPIRADEDWKEEVQLVYETLSEYFNIRVNNSCSMHVHVTPGTSTVYPYYTKEQIADVACGTCYWENPLHTIMPKDRKENPYAVANTTHIPNLMKRYGEFYAAGSTKKWAHVFGPFLTARTRSVLHVVDLMYGNKDRVTPPKKEHPNDYNKYMSTNFCNIQATCGTVEFRRQGGASSHEQANKQIIFALAMHVSMLQENWTTKGGLNAKPTPQDFINELMAGMTRLPTQSRHEGFKAWLDGMLTANRSAIPGKLSDTEVAKINKIQQKHLYIPSAFATTGIHSRPGTPVQPGSPLQAPAQWPIDIELDPWAGYQS